jgi:5-methylcytosine-specific restriction enzyme A
MPYRPCNEAGCPNFARPGSGKCDEHARAYERERSRRRRERGRKRIYARKKWEMTRKKVFSEQPLCAACGKRIAEECDHIVPLEDDPAQYPYALDGLQGLCRECHWEKTAKENAARGGRVP